MTSKSKLALAGLIFSAFASPVFAAQLGVGGDPVTDGRYYPGVPGPQTTYHPAPPAKIFHAPSTWMADTAANERLAIGAR